MAYENPGLPCATVPGLPGHARKARHLHELPVLAFHPNGIPHAGPIAQALDDKLAVTLIYRLYFVLKRDLGTDMREYAIGRQQGRCIKDGSLAIRPHFLSPVRTTRTAIATTYSEQDSTLLRFFTRCRLSLLSSALRLWLPPSLAHTATSPPLSLMARPTAMSATRYASRLASGGIATANKHRTGITPNRRASPSVPAGSP